MVFLSATQDIAVDGTYISWSYRNFPIDPTVIGWALTLLSHENLSYASTCQTIGLNTGYFASFTVFLALNSEAFAARWGTPRLSLDTYLRFWALLCYAVTIWLTLFQKEVRTVVLMSSRPGAD